jgi:TolB protein
VINDTITIPGKLAYVKAGNIWVLDGSKSSKVTDTGRDSQPTWSPDGTWIYFIETRTSRGKYPDPDSGVLRTFDLNYPVLSRVKEDGSGREALMSGLYRPQASTKYYYFIKAPAVSPDGTKVAVTSDGPIASDNNVVLQIFDIRKKRMTNLDLPQYRVLGHQDPAWSPDRKYLVYVRNGAEGPQVWRYNLETKKARAFTDSGYTQPVYSPNGRYIAATKTNSIGNNVVILDGRTGAELARVTTNERSWGPAWSPDGKQIVFMALAKSGLSVDMHLATLSFGSDGVPALDGETKALTKSSGLDSASRPAWWGDKTDVTIVPDTTASPDGSGSPDATSSDLPTATPGASAP